jgi:hypothetical protein
VKFQRGIIVGCALKIKIKSGRGRIRNKTGKMSFKYKISFEGVRGILEASRYLKINFLTI